MKKIALLFPLNQESLERYVRATKALGYMPVVVVKQPQKNISCETIIASGDLTHSKIIIEALDKLKHVVAIIACGEFSVELAEHIAKALDLDCTLKQSAQIFRNKWLMRKTFAKVQISQPECIGLADNLTTLKDISKAIKKFPVISKPVDMAGSWYVNINQSAADIIKHAQPIFDYSHAKTTGLAFACQCLIETYIAGDEYSAEVIVNHGQLVDYVIHKKYLSALPYFDEVGHIGGLSLSAELNEKLKQILKKIIAVTDIMSTILHIEFKMAADNIYIIEAGCRLPGDRLSNLVELQYGVNLETVMVQLKLGAKIDKFYRIHDDCIGIRFLFKHSDPLSDKVVCLQECLFDDVKANTNVSATHITHRQGYQVITAKDSSELAGCF